MERKIGEIFEYNGEWYQCVECDSCGKCSLYITECGSGIKSDLADEVFGECSKIRRSDSKHVIFKKLEKIGEPYGFQKRTFQTYRLHTIPFLSEDVELVVIPSKDNNTIEIEIKQNKKEDMGIDKVVMNIDDRDYLLDRLEAILHDTHCQQYKDEICEAFSKYIVTENVSNSKPFNLEEAKAGKPVCTRDGRKARIICFDAKCNLPIIALITQLGGDESLARYKSNGRYTTINESDCDLMMLPEKKSGWMNVYKEQIYDTKEGAIKVKYDGATYIDTIKISWEE